MLAMQRQQLLRQRSRLLVDGRLSVPWVCLACMHAPFTWICHSPLRMAIADCQRNARQPVALSAAALRSQPVALHSGHQC